jgi:UDP-N-acetylmuramate dehydrogenase
MVLDPADPDSCSVGSFFMNPLLSSSELQALEAALERRGTELEEMPRYDAGRDLTKVPAAWLIEQAGFSKGETMGRAAISTKHSLALVNRGGATAADILALARAVRAGVRDQLTVVLQPEPRFIGFDRPVATLLDDGPKKG